MKLRDFFKSESQELVELKKKCVSLDNQLTDYILNDKRKAEDKQEFIKNIMSLMKEYKVSSFEIDGMKFIKNIHDVDKDLLNKPDSREGHWLQ